MIPYLGVGYFVLVALLAVPAVTLQLMGRTARLWVLAASLALLLVHYGSSFERWDGIIVRDLWVVAAFAAFQLALAMLVLRARRAAASVRVVDAAIVVALAPLVVVKAAPLVAPAASIGFLGISFITFRALDVLFAVRDQLAPELRATTYLSYLLFFPTISAGPIDRYRRFLADDGAVRDRAAVWRDVDRGVRRVFDGLLAKFVIAELVRVYWMQPVRAGGGWRLLSFTYAYSFYLYFDFAGYSAIAIGVSHWLGYRVPENFRRPFLAGNIVDFWLRWHISLSTWLRDQVYMRLVIAATRGRWFARRDTASYLGIVCTFMAMGLWHGFALRYVAYGLYHAALMSAHGAASPWIRAHPALQRSAAWRVASVVVTFHAVCLGFLIFSGRLG